MVFSFYDLFLCRIIKPSTVQLIILFLFFRYYRCSSWFSYWLLETLVFLSLFCFISLMYIMLIVCTQVWCYYRSVCFSQIWSKLFILLNVIVRNQLWGKILCIQLNNFLFVNSQYECFLGWIANSYLILFFVVLLSSRGLWGPLI